ncbi:MAG: PolC-type DNA polymerase III [Clostridiales bacterium]|jgi:DNA polymerase-3 subunit alpha (Gram-positive type)|nr:PolC-type DNA polymerase III [Clostridiales bacterium]
MSLYSFSEIFPEVPEPYPDINIKQVVVDAKKRTMSIVVVPPSIESIGSLEAVSEALKRTYQLSSLEVSLKLPESSFDDGVKLAMQYSSREFPYAEPLLEGCQIDIDGFCLAIKVRRGGIDMLKSWSERVINLVKQWYDCIITVNITNGCDMEELIEQNEAEKNESIDDEVKRIAKPAKTQISRTRQSGALMGRKTRLSYIDMSQITLELGTAAVKGEIFAIDHREIKNRDAYILCFDITDYTGSVRINSFMESSRAKPIIDELEVGLTVGVQGRISFNKYENDIVLEPSSIIIEAPLPQREDNAERKRVELHLHTRMSSFDGVLSAKEAVERAAAWGHKAVAITDHGVVQAFPEAMAAAEKINRGKDESERFKVIYGTEAYFHNDIERLRSVYGDTSADLEGEFVAFDIETTGLSSQKDEIIEIGAAIFYKGEIIDTFNSFVKPSRRIPEKITELTGITDDMVADAPPIDVALKKFLEFSNGRVFAAHNALFDIGFVSEACKRLSIPFAPTFIDTRNMARGMLPDLKKFDLHTVATELQVPKFTHHRASADAGAVAYILALFFELLLKAGIKDIQEINSYLASKAGTSGKTHGGSNHMIILVKNEIGLRNLYELISLSHIKYFRRNPIIPRSELDSHRDGLLVGSACESGELYRAILNGKSEEEVIRIASYYDFLEIQPLGNNEFLIRDGKVGGREALKDINRRIVDIGSKLGIPVVATCDVHFFEPRDEVYRRILMAGKGFSDADLQPPLYFRTTEEMLGEFSYLGEKKAYEVVIENTNLISDKCDFVMPIREGTYAPEIEGSAEQLHILVESKVRELYGENPPSQVRERVDVEMGSIIKHHFDVIYMIAQKLVDKSLRDGYLVGSRGSVGSSIVAFFAGITEVNSLEPHYRCPNCMHSDFNHGFEVATGPDLPDMNCPKCGTPYEKDGFDIPFATFLGFDGDKKPDIDLNFSGEYQARAHKETEEIFGKGKVFRAGTIGTIAEKTAYGFVKKYMEERGNVVSRAEENRLIQGIVGVKRTTGQHPGGLIVVPKDNSIYEFTPVQYPADDRKSGIITTHFDYHSIEDNLLKLDLLGHDDPTMIRMLYDLTGFDPQQIPLDDSATMSIFTSTEALGFTNDPICGSSGTFAVPEFGTRFVREMLSQTKPRTFDELIRISGLSHGTDVWINNGQELIKSGTATLKQIIAARDDIMIYLMSKGLDRKTAFTIMESVRKGRGLRPEWEEEMRSNDVPEWYLDSCNKIKYMFPKAHAVAYVLMAFRIAYYKVHYPKEFYSAYFSIRATSFDAEIMIHGIEPVVAKIREIEGNPNAKAVEKEMLTTLEVVYEFYKRGFSFDPIDLYLSDAKMFIPGEKSLRPPFTAIPGLGETAAGSIVAARKDGKFLSVEEITMRCPRVSKATIEQLRANGALGDLPDTSQITLF